MHILKPGKIVTLVLANNAIEGVVIPIDEIVVHLLELNGFISVGSRERKIKSHRRRYPFGIQGFKGPMNVENVLQAVKPSS